jgi:parvulin-like peptidyl-prolyl isomerase
MLAYGTVPVTPASFTRTGPIDPVGAWPAANEEAFRTPLGSLTGVLETPAGFAIIRPEASTPPNFSDFETIKDGLRQETLAEQQSARVTQWLADLRARARLRSFVDSEGN